MNYDGSPFNKDPNMYVVRFTSKKTEATVVKSYGGSTDAYAKRVAELIGEDENLMIKAAYPYTGTSQTLNINGGAGAFELNTAGTYMKVDNGAAIYKLSRFGGEEKLVAVRIRNRWRIVE